MSPKNPINIPMNFFMFNFSPNKKKAANDVIKGDKLYIIQALDDDILFNPHISNILFKYILKIDRYKKYFKFLKFINFKLLILNNNIIAPAIVILNPIKKNGSEYFRLSFCKEKILANKKNKIITKINLLFRDFNEFEYINYVI